MAAKSKQKLNSKIPSFKNEIVYNYSYKNLHWISASIGLTPTVTVSSSSTFMRCSTSFAVNFSPRKAVPPLLWVLEGTTLKGNAGGKGTV